MAAPIITLTTDFGLTDWFVGTMRGVIASIAPRALVIDLTQEVPAGDSRVGAFALAAGYRYFPKGTIHVAVIDPGVGSKRQAIAVRTKHYFFVGPDNGLLSLALQREKVTSIHRLENKRYFLPSISRTFHGRDVFAPVAAHLAKGVAIEKFGPPLLNFVRLDWPQVWRKKNRLEGEVIYLDRFGNGITNLEVASIGVFKGAKCELYTKQRRVIPLGNHYQAVPERNPVVVPGSSGFLEIAVNGGSAQAQLGLTIGTRVVLIAGQGN